MARKTVLACLSLLVLAHISLAEEIPVRIKANDLKYDQEAGMITGAGSVEIYFEDAVIYSDRAWVDTNVNIATAEGRVKIKHEDYDILSSILTYDMSTETSVVFKLKTVFYPSDIKSNLYVSAYKLTDLSSVKMGEYGSITTCDYDEPHYHIKARWFDYYPDDKLVGYWVMLFVGGAPTPVLTPYYVYNIKKKRSPYSFAYGENAVEGKFLKTSFDYFINNSANGIFYFDTTQIKGPGYGVLHDYQLNNENSGTLYYYKMDEQDTKLKDYVFRLNHNIRMDSYSNLTLIHNTAFIYQVPAGRKYDTSSSINYSRDTGQHKLSYGYSENEDKYAFLKSETFNINNSYGGYNTSFKWYESKSFAGQKWKSIQDTFHHDQSVYTDDLKFFTNVNYSSYVTDEGFIADEKLEPWIDLTYKGAFYSAKLTQNWYVDVDGDRFRGDDNYEYLERMPELSVSFDRLNLNYFNLDLGVGAARFHEAKYVPAYTRMRHITTNRYSFSSYFSRSDDIGFGSTLRSGIGYDQFHYELGDERFQYRESLNLQTNLGGFFSNTIDWGRARIGGNTPFFFESLGSQYNYIKDNITLYYSTSVTQHISGGYNYMNSMYDDVLTDVSVNLNPLLYVSVATGWSIENQRYRDLVGSATLTPFPNFINTGSLVYDMNVGKLMSANSVVDLVWGDVWEERFHFKMEHSYDFNSDLYILRNIAIVKDLHCWEATFSYSDYMKEWRFGMSLKAFPSYPLSYVAGPGGNYFNSFMNNMHFEQESPRRY